jgi:hypothetical protein
MAAVALPGDPDVPRQQQVLLFGGVIDPWSLPNTLSDATFIYRIEIELPTCSSDERYLCINDQRIKVAAVAHQGQLVV